MAALFIPLASFVSYGMLGQLLAKLRVVLVDGASDEQSVTGNTTIIVAHPDGLKSKDPSLKLHIGACAGMVRLIKNMCYAIYQFAFNLAVFDMFTIT